MFNVAKRLMPSYNKVRYLMPFKLLQCIISKMPVKVPSVAPGGDTIEPFAPSAFYRIKTTNHLVPLIYYSGKHI